MPVAWPAGIPWRARRGGYQAQGRDNILRTPMDGGPAKTRRQFIGGPKPVTWPLRMSKAQFEEWLDWHDDDLAEGALSFTLPGDVNGDARTAKLTAPYSETRAPGGAVLLTLQLVFLD